MQSYNRWKSKIRLNCRIIYRCEIQDKKLRQKELSYAEPLPNLFEHAQKSANCSSLHQRWIFRSSTFWYGIICIILRGTVNTEKDCRGRKQTIVGELRAHLQHQEEHNLLRSRTAQAQITLIDSCITFKDFSLQNILLLQGNCVQDQARRDQ